MAKIGTVTLPLLLLFIMGVANFALHKAMLESGDPIITEAVGPLLRLGGPYLTYAMEFALLLLAFLLAEAHPRAALLLYGVYTMVNALGWNWIRQRGDRR